MVVAKRQRREKPAKIEQRGLERGPEGEQTASWLAQFTQGRPGGRRKHIKKGAKGPEASLSPLPHACSFSLSLSLLFSSLGQYALMPRGCIFLLFSK